MNLRELLAIFAAAFARVHADQIRALNLPPSTPARTGIDLSGHLEVGDVLTFEDDPRRWRVVDAAEGVLTLCV